jgi:hypothetical protein
MPGEAEAQRFRALFEQGELQYQRAEFGAAIASFREADRQRATPEVAYDLAKCHERIGDGAFMVYYYRLYLRRAPSAADGMEVAEHIGTALAKAESEGRGFLELEAMGATDIVVNGRTFPEPPVATFLAPGDYEVVAQFPNGRRGMTVQVRTGKTTSRVFEPLQPPLVGLERRPLELVQVKAAPVPGPSRLRVASYVTATAALVALVTGATLGALAMADTSRIQADHNLTVSEGQKLAAGASTKGVAANVLFGAGGAAVIGASAMFVFSMPEPGMKPAGDAR